jgi:hypothetical protein
MNTAHQWLLDQGQHPDSLCLTMQIDDHGFWLFNDTRNHCFCIVAKKEVWPLVGNPVLAYSTESDIFVKEDLRNYNSMVNPYRLQITALQETTGQHIIADTVRYQPQHHEVKPLLALTKWGQYEPYNLMTPEVNGQKTLVGCVPLAMGMIAYYHQWPEKGRSHTYYQSGKEIYKLEFSDWCPQWQSFRKDYEKRDSTIGAAELSTMLVTLGYAVDAEFSSEGTAAETEKVKSTLCNNMLYSGRITTYQEPTVALAEDILRRDLDHQLPCIVGNDSHVFVCDGYKDVFLHFNMGWYGNYNGYYRLRLGNGNPDTEEGHTLLKNIIAHIEPQREEVEREVKTEQPGTLQQLLTEEELQQVTQLKVSGPLNSADIRLLRKMAGADIQPSLGQGWQGGSLRELDLQDATIVEDEEPYLTMRAKGCWTKRVSVGQNVKKVVKFDFETMTDAEWRTFAARVGTKKDGFRYTRTGDKRCWVHYSCQANTVGNHMFSKCSSLRKIVLPRGTVKVDDYAFYECVSLQEIEIPPTTREVGKMPFSYCLSLERIAKPRTLITGGEVFEHCSPVLQGCTNY